MAMGGKINFKLRDAIYSRQRYWGEPFPIAYDADGVAHPLPLNELPLELPELGRKPLASIAVRSEKYRRATGTNVALC